MDTLVEVDDDVAAKLRLFELHHRHGLTELEEAWLIRSPYRDDGLTQPEIARWLARHKSWVCRRLVLVEALDPAVQADAHRAARAARGDLLLPKVFARCDDLFGSGL